MENNVNALQPEGGAKPAQIAPRIYDVTVRDRRFLFCTLAFCVLLADSFWPNAGLTVLVFAWYVLVLAYVGPKSLAVRFNQVLLLANLFLAATFALGSNFFFRMWNFLALAVLLPVHTIALSGAGRLPWQRPAMLWERLCLLLCGLFGNLGAGPAALSAGKQEKRRTGAVVLGLCGALVLVAFLLPVLASADALFAATADLRHWISTHLGKLLWRLIAGLCLTPFVFSLLYALRRPAPLKTAWKDLPSTAEPLVFSLMLGALDVLYLLFLGVQSAGLFGGPEYLAQRGISYAEWARSGFFQMVGVTVLNLTVMLAALTFAKRDRLPRILAGALTLESLVLLASAAWRMTLYVSAYGLSFKRCMTYWGMGMMALLFLAAAWKVFRPDFGFCKAAFPLLLAGWLAVNCVPVDYLVAKDQVDRCLSGQSAAVDVRYLLYGLSYDTLSQLERLDGDAVYELGGRSLSLSCFLAERREYARWDCADWHTWSLSACLAAN